MAKSTPFTLTMVAIGGVAVGFLAAQTINNRVIEEESSSSIEASVVEQDQTSEALVGLESLTLGETTRGEITSASELNGNDGSRFLRYAISLEEGELVEISLRGALQGIVTLYDDQLELLKSAPIVRERIEQSGNYLVVVSGADVHSYGPFSVNSRAIELSDSDTLNINESMVSWLGGAGHEVTLNIAEAGMYQIEMRSDDFDAYLELEGPNGYYRGDDDSAGNLDARITDFLASGDYTLRARSAYDDSEGVFTLNAEAQELPAGGELRSGGSITTNDSLNGWYSGQDLVYTLEVEEEGVYQIDMSSSDVDAYLVLEGTDYYREDDDSGGNLDARIVDILSPGTYQLIARTAYSNGSGLFSLSVESSNPPEGVELRNGGELRADESLTGWYSSVPLSYELTLEESSFVTVAMNAADFDAFLELTGEGVSYSDDDGGQGTNALLQQSLLPGTYTVSVRSFGAQGSGMFELEVSVEPTEITPET